MKHLKWIYGAIALTMLGACSDRDYIEPVNESQSASDGAVEGYVAVQVRLPQEVMTRTEDTGGMNDQYADGTAAEYNVENSMIVLFKSTGSDEKDAEFQRAQYLTKPFFTNLPADDPVSASYIAAIQVKTAPEKNENLWALVILNADETSTYVDADNLYIAGQPVAVSTKFSEFQKLITTNNLVNVDPNTHLGSKFFMINAPMWKVETGKAMADGEVTYLTNLGNKIYDTPEEAKSNVSGCVYVERAVSKVTCQKFDPKSLSLTFIDENGNEVDLSSKDWDLSESTVNYTLANTPQKSYVLRNVDFSDATHFSWTFAVNNRPRMFGLTPIPGLSDPFHAESVNLYRTYWCRDPHYSVAMTAADKNPTGDFVGLDVPLYCKENTFQVQHQNFNSSTLAIFEVDLNLKHNGKLVETMYVRDGNTSKVYLDPESACYDGVTRIIHDLNVQNAIKAAAKGSLPSDFSVKDHLIISFDKETKGKIDYLKVKSIELNVTSADIAAGYFDAQSKTKFNQTLGAAKQDIIDKVNLLADITIYKNAKSYYAVPIKHFGDYYTPWNEKTKGVTTSEVYDNGGKFTTSEHAEKYLGRYGTVRNNWYELNISKVAALGSPVIPDTNVTLSDDNNEDKKYFSVEIHILSWAKRLQNVVF